MAGRGGGEGVRIRDHLANVRTLLAWTRLAAAILAVAYVIAKLDLMSRIQGTRAIGVAGGAAAALVAAFAMSRYIGQRSAIEHEVFRPDPRRDIALIVLTAAGGVAVLAYLLLIR
jgi:uncharacterized membrane protein YidH (DUF202 family)